MTIKKIIRRAEFFIAQFPLIPSYLYIFYTKRNQKDVFKTLRQKCLQYYDFVADKEIFEFLTHTWKDYDRSIKEIIFPQPRFSFLLHRIIRESMFAVSGGKWVAEPIKFIEGLIPKARLGEILQEDYIGFPILINATWHTSQNTIHSFYHLMKFQKETGVAVETFNTIIEWGGGYGNMAKIVKRMAPHITYIIIDLPSVSCLQWLYLATIFGENSVNMVYSPEIKIKEGKINLLPLCFLKQYRLDADFFIAMWSLSESSKNAQDYVSMHDFFGAKHLLLGCQESGPAFPWAQDIGKIAVKRGAIIQPMDFMPGSSYIFQ